MQQKQPNQKKNNTSGLNKYVEYSGIAFQMVAIILAFVWAGKKVDEKYFNGDSVFIIVFSLLGVVLAMYIVLKDFIKISRKK
jgi:F0F1-type ATP synthase assembly protein I